MVWLFGFCRVSLPRVCMGKCARVVDVWRSRAWSQLLRLRCLHRSWAISARRLRSTILPGCHVCGVTIAYACATYVLRRLLTHTHRHGRALTHTLCCSYDIASVDTRGDGTLLSEREARDLSTQKQRGKAPILWFALPAFRYFSFSSVSFSSLCLAVDLDLMHSPLVRRGLQSAGPTTRDGIVEVYFSLVDSIMHVSPLADKVRSGVSATFDKGSCLWRVACASHSPEVVCWTSAVSN